MNKPLASIVVGSALLALSLAAGILGLTDAAKQEAKSLDHIDWMSAHGDEEKISDLAIPGTHDTLALYGIGDLAGQCQSLSLGEQLKLGVRFLDIRLQQENDSLKAVHGIVDERQTFQSVIKAMSKFLKEHPRESLFVSIKEESKAKGSRLSFEDCLRKYIVTEDWYLGSTIPETLGQCRGKMVLFSRYASSHIGIPSYDGWNDNASFVLNEDIYVQDFYKFKDVKKKKAEITTCFTADYPYRINFLSGYLEGSFPPSYAPSVAKTINPWIKETLPSVDKRGFLLFDFVTSELMDAYFGGEAK